jgi:hypothetical protein
VRPDSYGQTSHGKSAGNIKQRCCEVYAELGASRGKLLSRGADLWIVAVDFTDRGGWSLDIKEGEKGLFGYMGKKFVKSESRV